MTMDGDAVGSFEDWELLVNSDSDLINSPISIANSSRLTHPISLADSSRSFEEIMVDTESMFRLDYLSLENDNRYVKTTLDSTDEGSVESDHSIWIDPDSKTPFQRRNSSDQWLWSEHIFWWIPWQ